MNFCVPVISVDEMERPPNPSFDNVAAQSTASHCSFAASGPTVTAGNKPAEPEHELEAHFMDILEEHGVSSCLANGSGSELSLSVSVPQRLTCSTPAALSKRLGHFFAERNATMEGPVKLAADLALIIAEYLESRKAQRNRSAVVTSPLAASTTSVRSLNRTTVRDYTSAAVMDEYVEGRRVYKQVNDYALLQPIGEGSFSVVYLARHVGTGIIRAVKIARRGLNDLSREADFLKRLSHKNIIRLYEVIDDPTQSDVYFVVEHASKGPVVRLNPVSRTCQPIRCEAKLRRFVRQVAAGLTYLHRRNTFHRDIKPDNILVDGNDQIKLSDFGISQQDPAALVDGYCGTPAFVAPECSNAVLMRLGGDVSPSTRVGVVPAASGEAMDMWALGVTIYCMKVGSLPFNGKTRTDLLRAICEDAPTYPPGLSREWRDFFNWILRKEPNLRMTLKELKRFPLFDQFPSVSSRTREMVGRFCAKNKTKKSSFGANSSTATCPSPSHRVPRASALGISGSNNEGLHDLNCATYNSLPSRESTPRIPKTATATPSPSELPPPEVLIDNKDRSDCKAAQRVWKQLPQLAPLSIPKQAHRFAQARNESPAKSRLVQEARSGVRERLQRMLVRASCRLQLEPVGARKTPSDTTQGSSGEVTDFLTKSSPFATRKPSDNRVIAGKKGGPPV